jgi:hypothetical protein
MNVPGFSQEALDLVGEMLYAEGQTNPMLGKCGQKRLREQGRTPRTAAEEQADKARAQASQGKNSVPSSVRSEAAKKAAATRKRCRAGSSNTSSPATTA